METKVSGAPVTDETLKAMSQYSGKEELTPKFDKATTICMVHNATGYPLELVTPHDWAGVIQGSYPRKIENGQLAFFVHESRVAALGTASFAAVVYRCKNAAGEESDWMFSWYNCASTLPGYTAYTEIREKDHFIGEELWKKLEQLTTESQAESSDEYWYGLWAKVYIKPEAMAVYRAVVSLEGADKPDA